jgi:hypothetical protein
LNTVAVIGFVKTTTLPKCILTGTMMQKNENCIQMHIKKVAYIWFKAKDPFI